ncbi:MAG: hypothetical protein WCX97_00690 [Candidatus Magasanikbacteria bacterium]
MQILRKYQLDIIFLFFALLLIGWTMFYFLQSLGVDPHNYEWHIIAPLLTVYTINLIRVRSTIAIADRRYLTGKSLAYWITLGIIFFASYETPIPASDYWSINTLFLVFTLFLADSYWDFKRLTIKNLFKK